MSAWKQLLISLVVLAAAFFGWIHYFPSASGVLEKAGLAKPLARLGIEVASGPSDGNAARGGNGRGGGRFSRTASVVVKPAGSAVINDSVSALGSGAALQSVTLVAQASGTLTEVPVQSGAHVSKGDVVAKLDAVAEQLAYDKARLANEDAEKTLSRNQALAKSNAVSASTLQSAELAARVAELNVRSAAQDLAERTITAPISGQLGIIQVNPGNEITTQTTIATIEDTSALLVNFWLPDRLVGSVKAGDTATMVPVARPQLTLEAKVTAIDNRVDAASGTYEVQARLENPDGSLRPGMAFTVSMRFPGDRFTSVDPLSIQWGSDGAYVWRVEQNKVQRVSVRIVQRNTEDVLVAGKLAEGDQIVTEGLDGLHPGAEVKVLNQNGQGAQADGAGPRQATSGGGNGQQQADAQASQGGKSPSAD